MKQQGEGFGPFGHVRISKNRWFGVNVAYSLPPFQQKAVTFSDVHMPNGIDQTKLFIYKCSSAQTSQAKRQREFASQVQGGQHRD
eukprot:6202272-Pleurochrysis_carterae.AAC.2